MVVKVLRLIALTSTIWLAYHKYSAGALQGAGDTKFPMYTTLIGIWVVRVVVWRIFYLEQY